MIKTILAATASLLLLVACGQSAEPKGSTTATPPIPDTNPADNSAPKAKSDLTLTYFNLGG